MHLGNREFSETKTRECYENFCLEVIERIGLEPWPCKWNTEVKEVFEHWQKSKVWPRMVHAMIRNLFAKFNVYGPLFTIVEGYLYTHRYHDAT